ncbi:MAG: hypothetical protein M4579_006536 [Chaenotheca gracillima]|nr:MAG: hypothetical protein M4579_006536 [Chaenotheca gracillima]
MMRPLLRHVVQTSRQARHPSNLSIRARTLATPRAPTPTLHSEAPTPRPPGSVRPLTDDGTVSPFMKVFPILVLIGAGTSIFYYNYRKTNSPVTAATMEALRTSTAARAALGDDIDFEHSLPWIWGQIKVELGRVDVSFRVKGSKSKGIVRFHSRQQERNGPFEPIQFALQTPDGTVLPLLEMEGRDPLAGVDLTPKA